VIILCRILLTLLLVIVSSEAFAEPITAFIAANLTSAIVSKILVSTVISIAFSYISRALAPKPRVSERRSGITQLIRASAEPHKIIYGERVVSGVLTFAATEHSTSGGSPTGDNLYLHLVVSLAGHQCEEIKTVFLNDVGVDDSDLDANGLATSGRFSPSFVRIKKHLGLWDQAADTHMLDNAVAGGIGAVWTSAHQGKNITYIYLRLVFDQTVYPTGIPNIKALIKGRLVADPRNTAITVTSTSVADPTVVTTSSAHGLVAGNRAFITNHAGSVPIVYGEYAVLSAPTTTTLTIDENVTTGGTGGTLLEMLWTNNASLCLRDYLLADFGVAADQTDEMDDTATNTAADICDEEVLYPAAVDTFDFTVSASTDVITQTVVSATPPNKPKACHPFDGVEFTTTGTLPAGLALATRVWVYDVGGKSDPFTFKVASTLVNARLGVTINITDTGSGTHTLTRKSQPRYTTDGVFFLDNDPIDVVPELIDPTGGIIAYTQGRYTMFAGAWTGPATVTLTESDLRGELAIRPKPGKAEIHNGVRGIFHDRDNKYEPTDFTQVSDATAVANDLGEEIYKEVVFTFVTDQHRAQRLAWLINRRMRPPTSSRHSTVIEVKANLRALQIAVGDVVDVTIDRPGWAAKEFEVMAWNLQADAGINLVLKESASTVYSFDPENDEVIIDPAPNTRLHSAFDAPQDITGMALASGTAELLAQADGTIVSRIKVTWNSLETSAVREIAVTEGGRIEIQTKKNADSIWDTAEFVSGDQVEFWVTPVLDGTSYDVRIRAVNRLLVPSANFTTVSNHTVVGKTAAPANVANLASTQGEFGDCLSWDAVTDADLHHYELRQGSGSWAAAAFVADVLGTTYNAGFTAATRTWQIKAIDTSGNESATEDTVVSTITAPSNASLAGGIQNNSVLLTWANTENSFPINYTEVRRGSVFSSAAVLGKFTVDSVALTDQPEGSQTYWVRATDVAGNDATETSVAPTVLKPAGRITSFQVFTGDGTWTRPSGITHIMVEVVGGGGGGGGSSSSDNTAGGGGGGGGYSKELIDVTSISSATVTIGAGGTAGGAETDNAGAGGTTSFGSGPLIQATGGVGGLLGTGSQVQAAGGVGTLGDINLTGQKGHITNHKTVSSGSSAGAYGHATTPVLGDSVGVTADVHGNGGGAGFRVSTTSRAGGAGSAGICVVEEYE